MPKQYWTVGVRRVVFVWGGAAGDGEPKPSTVHPIDGVDVVYGVAAARAWRERIRADASHAAADHDVREVWQALERQVRKRDEYGLRSERPLPSLSRLSLDALGLLIIGALGFYIAVGALGWLDSWWLWAAAVVALAGLGVGARVVFARRAGPSWATEARLATTAWLAGLGGAVASAVGLLVNAALR